MADRLARLLLTVPEAAAELGVSRAFLYRMVASGDIVSFKLGRARRQPYEELQRWVRERAAQAQVESR